jgi:pyruvate/2-oxoacid:ferredoxin oxidoreductase alpha subunit
MEGAHAVSWAARAARVEVVAAYPITPSTHVVELLAEMVADGTMDAQYIQVESEHSALAAVIGAAATGARAFTATSSQGLALMHEVLHWAAGSRLPIVIANANRALGPGWNIWADQTDSLAQRDTGWMQVYCEDVQEVVDTTLMAFKLAERVRLPMMVMLDAFFLSHTYEPVDLPEQAAVDAFLPPWEPEDVLDPAAPRAFNQLSPPDVYTEFRHKMQAAMERALEEYEAIDREYGERFGRSYGACEHVPAAPGEQASLALVTTGTATSTARAAQAEAVAAGTPFDLVKLKLFRPFPAAEVRRLLGPYARVAVVDRDLSFGAGGIFAQEIQAALASLDTHPTVYPFVAGLGGRDITVASILDMVRRALGDEPTADLLWADLKEA